MPRAFLIKKKQFTHLGGNVRSTSPKLFSPSSSGIESPNSSIGSTSSPRNDENELAPRYESPSPKYSFERDTNQCLDLSMKSLLKEANNLSEMSVNKPEYSTRFNNSIYNEPSFVSSYPYPAKFAKIADFLRNGELSKNTKYKIDTKSQTTPQVSSPSVTSIFKTVDYLSEESASCPTAHRLPPYSINWSEHFSVHKFPVVSPTGISQASDDSGRGSCHSEDICMDKSNESVSSRNGKKKSDRFQCPDCNKSYSTQSGLAKHQEFHCSSQVKKSFSCKHCEKVYVSLGALKMHIRTHTLPCKCKLCGKAFSRPWLLQGHIRTHTGEKPFACQYCNRAFADRSNLRAHLQTHSVVKKYSCKTCSRTFSRMSLLLKHEDNGCNGARMSTITTCEQTLASPQSMPIKVL